MRDDSKKTTLRMVDMEASYLTVDFFRKLPQEIEKGGNAAATASDRYTDGHLRRIGNDDEFPKVCVSSHDRLTIVPVIYGSVCVTSFLLFASLIPYMGSCFADCRLERGSLHQHGL
jgi:hypothetical protein